MVWSKGGKVIKVPFVIGVGTRCVYLKPFCKWSRASPFATGVGAEYCIKQALKTRGVNTVPYRPVRSVYTVPASKPVRLTPLFCTGKNTGRIGQFWAIPAGTEKKFFFFIIIIF